MRRNELTKPILTTETMEFIYFINFIRREFIKKYSKSLESIDENNFIESDKKKIAKMKSYLLKDFTVVSDIDLIDILKFFNKSADEYFKELNELLFGQLYAVYNSEQHKKENKILSFLLKEIEKNSGVVIPPSMDMSDYESVYSFINNVRMKWKELKKVKK